MRISFLNFEKRDNRLIDNRLLFLYKGNAICIVSKNSDSLSFNPDGSGNPVIAYQIVDVISFVPRNDRLKRTAGIAFADNPTDWFLLKESPD
ncbi:hypothetical protein [Flavobacterium dankookense]|uniref:hypothetical protein n=1 Tax=Flavobacterium dankookense TaxID=706186 RepID=UPI00106001D7|nr:hypothetical protein [Flavobacterium dankookense]